MANKDKQEKDDPRQGFDTKDETKAHLDWEQAEKAEQEPGEDEKRDRR